ncbi:saccharopine dehydrogenase C-terminal domain-containing protein [Magnetospirillum moscoviense]|uniref:Saccharopine dehydrogenase n=1 Tax=Magnetospirillum moscoviense TaxID=1437059 RepID=A0A178N0C1_9PROT|nr:saccharopine dehydrogenase C-terminal domain-containing protein [Magnetospirillum moscoviense]OAN58032.1 saccharopine dehydrogenase [Magnetospirillum moscoviense]
MHSVVVLGSGKIGITVAAMLADSGDWRVTLADSRPEMMAGQRRPGLEPIILDVTDPFALRAALSGHHAVVSTLPYFLCAEVAEAALAEGVHYFDPTEDIATAHAIRKLAQGAGTVAVPQCGLAPGFVSIAAKSLADGFDEILDVRLRVGALPQYPDNALKYNLTWSTDGLINEYCNPCQSVVDGRLIEVLPLEGLEHFSLDGIAYEAFSTSGGVGTLCETLAGRVRNLDYKTVRYPGHRDLIRMLARDLKLSERRELFRDVIENAIPITRQDVVLIFVTVVGRKSGRLMQESWVRKIYGDDCPGGRSAIQKTTAGAICAMIDLHQRGQIPQTGFVCQEQVSLSDFLANRFGAVYA